MSYDVAVFLYCPVVTTHPLLLADNCTEEDDETLHLISFETEVVKIFYSVLSVVLTYMFTIPMAALREAKNHGVTIFFLSNKFTASHARHQPIRPKDRVNLLTRPLCRSINKITTPVRIITVL